MVLGVVLLALALSYVFPLRIYLTQQAEITALRASQAAQRAHVAELAAEAQRWEDDEYVRIQARKRLHFSEPGEVLIITVWDDDEQAGDPRLDPGSVPRSPGSWWDTLWASVESANRTEDVATG